MTETQAAELIVILSYSHRALVMIVMLLTFHVLNTVFKILDKGGK